jgi:hypothetical protein
VTQLPGSLSSAESLGPRLRPATPDDIDAIAEVWHAGWPEGHLGHVPEALLLHRRLADFRARVPALLDRTTVATIGPGIFEHQAPIEGGTIPLAAHRYEKDLPQP